MGDERLVQMVVADLTTNLRGRASQVEDVYGICLLVDDVYGDFLISFATEGWFEPRKAPPPNGPPFEEVAAGPAGPRWSIGDWHRFPADDFLSGPTRAALEPLVARFRDDRVDDASERATWREIGLTALQRAKPVTLLPTTEQAIEFVAHPVLTPVEQAL